MIDKIEVIADSLSDFGLLQFKEFTRKFEKRYGVTVAIEERKILSGTMSTPVPTEIEEKIEFKLFLEEVPSDKKTSILKIIRTITGFGLKKSKDLVNSAPKLIKEGLTKESAELAKKQLEDVGAKITIK